ncbi:MAG: hypothetical protein HC802_09685 [Caldilineaceae bacterium]|nr:hypothetical protein [Caldilineaceae bacterium]
MIPQMPLLITIFMCMSAGILLGQYIGRPVLGFVGGLLIGAALGMATMTKRRRWLAALLLVIMAIMVVERDGLLGLMFLLTTFGLTLFVSSSILREFYHGSEFDAFREHMELLIGRNRGFTIVENGGVAVPAGQPTALGPFSKINCIVRFHDSCPRAKPN